MLVLALEFSRGSQPRDGYAFGVAGERATTEGRLSGPEARGKGRLVPLPQNGTESPLARSIGTGGRNLRPPRLLRESE